jgi:hypothetical protein
MGPPARALLGPVLTIPTLATGVMAVISVLLLLVRSVSMVPVGAVINAVLLNVPVVPFATTPTTVKTMLPPAGMLGIDNEIALLLLIPLGQIAPFVSLAQVIMSDPMAVGTVSVNIAFSAGLGPPLRKVML